MKRSLLSRFIQAVRLGVVSLVDDAGAVQRIQVDHGPAGPDGANAVVDGVPRIGQFGHASNPPLGSKVLVVRLGGNRSLSVAIGEVHKPSRPRDLQPGDSVLYDLRGQTISLTGDGCVIDLAGLPLVFRNFGAVARFEGDLQATGEVTAKCDAAPVDLSTHTHGGVQAGAADTDPPNPS